MQRAFGQVRTLVMEGADEFAVLTEEMREAEFKERAIALDIEWQKAGGEGIRQIIRAELED